MYVDTMPYMCMSIECRFKIMMEVRKGKCTIKEYVKVIDTKKNQDVQLLLRHPLYLLLNLFPSFERLSFKSFFLISFENFKYSTNTQARAIAGSNQFFFIWTMSAYVENVLSLDYHYGFCMTFSRCELAKPQLTQELFSNQKLAVVILSMH